VRKTNALTLQVRQHLPEERILTLDRPQLLLQVPNLQAGARARGCRRWKGGWAEACGAAGHPALGRAGQGRQVQPHRSRPTLCTPRGRLA
jgi:hypothetical protein